MTPDLEFEGKNVEKAVKAACEQLNIPREKLKYDVISYGSTGIFGLVGTKKAKIHVILPKPAEEPSPKEMDLQKEEDVILPKPTAEPSAKEMDLQKEEDVILPKPAEEPSPKEMGLQKEEDVILPKPAGEPSPKEMDLQKEEDVIHPAPAREPSPEEMDLEEERRRLVDEIIPPTAAGKEAIETPVRLQEGEIHAFPESPAVLGREVLQRILDFVTTGAEVLVEEEPEQISFKVEGGNPAVLIGKRGQTLEAIQYIVEKIVNKRSEGRILIQVDVEGYLESRRQSLNRLSTRLAEKAKRTGKPVTIGQLNAHDRRIVHLALKEDKGVRTQSVGDGYYRKLVIFPRKSSSRKRRNGETSK